MASTINVQLTDELRRHVDFRTSDDDVYATPSEYLRDLIRKDIKASKKAYDIEVAEMLMASLKSKATPMEPDYFDKIRRELKRTRAQAKKSE